MKRAYLNHAGTSWPKPDAVLATIQEAMSLSPRKWSDRFEAAQRSICDYFSIPRTEQLLLTPGCTSAIAIGISDLRWEEGDRVLHSRWEHHALMRPLLKLQEQGVITEAIPVGEDTLIDLNSLEEMLKQGGVKLVAIMAASNVTGQRLPVSEIIQLAHQYSALVFVDAAQIVGWFELNFPELGADLIAFGSHKGLQAPWGLGGLYISESVKMRCLSAQCEINIRPDSAIPSMRPGYCDVGSVDQWTLAGMKTAIELLQQQNVDQLRERRCQDMQAVQNLLEQHDHVTIHSQKSGQTQLEPTQQLPTLAFSIDQLNSHDVAVEIEKKGVIVSGGFQCAPIAHETLGTEETGVVRISFGIFQNDEDVNILLERLPEVLEHLR